MERKAEEVRPADADLQADGLALEAGQRPRPTHLAGELVLGHGSGVEAAEVGRRHGGRVENVVILEIDVPRTWLKRNRKGIWYTRRDVPPGRLRRVIDFIEVAYCGTACAERDAPGRTPGEGPEYR